MRTLRGLFYGLEAVNGADSGIDPVDFLVPVERAAADAQELVLLREADDGALEIALALGQPALRHLESTPSALGDAALEGTLPVVEGLSHLLYLVEAARRDRPVSGLELETQAEVDKLALCLLHRWPRPDFPDLVDRLLCQWHLRPGLAAALQARYLAANRVALGFARRLEPLVRHGQLGRLRQLLRRFFTADMPEKQRLAGA